MNERELISTLKKKKNYVAHLNDYTAAFSQLYYDYASIQLAFSYYTVFEMLSEDTDNTVWKQNLGQTVTDCLCLDKDEAISAVSALRDKITEVMHNITLYTDILSVFEHILNRVEYRFKEVQKPDISYVSTRIQQFIFADKDAVITNDKIKTIVAELPLRMTKQRFYDILSDSLDIYTGSDCSSVDGFLFMIRTIATLQGDLQPVEGIEGLEEFITRCNETDYAAISETEFLELTQMLERYGEGLTDLVNLNMKVQECVNHYYTMLLCKPYVKQSSAAGEHAQGMISQIKEHFNDVDSQLVLEGCNSYLEQLEGKQEDIMERVMGFEALLADVAAAVPDDSAVKDLLVCEKLVSSSLFIDLHQEEQDKEADSAYINKVKEELIADFVTFFKNHSQIVNRAIMSAVLGAVPVFFQNTEEIVQYIDYALEHCSDVSELCASVEIINRIME